MTNLKLTIIRIGAGLFGLIGLGTGAIMLFQGAKGKLGDLAPLITDPSMIASLDNDFRFLAAIWFIVGLGLLVGALFIHKKPDLVQIGLEAIILGGLARLFAFFEYGVQSQFIGPIAVEIVVPLVLLYLLRSHLREQNQGGPLGAHPTPA